MRHSHGQNRVTHGECLECGTDMAELRISYDEYIAHKCMELQERFTDFKTARITWRFSSPLSLRIYAAS